MHYDYLILATGSTHSYFGHDDWEPYAPGLKTVEDAIEIRRRVLLAFELAERQALEHGSHPPLNFVVVGGGPTGVELAGAISDISRLYMRKDFRHIDPSKAHVIVVEGSPRILATYPEDLSRKAEEELQGLGVEVRPIPGHRCPARLRRRQRREDRVSRDVVGSWGASFAAGKNAGCGNGQEGHNFCRPISESHLAIRTFLFAAIWQHNGKRQPYSRRCAACNANGHACSERNSGRLSRKPRTKFHYFDKGDMATIGRHNAVADLKWPVHAHMSGLPAWMAWLTIHISS